MTLADRDEVLLVAGSRAFVLEYDRPRTFLRWTWRQHVRARVTLRTLPLRELQQISRVYAELGKQLAGGLDLAAATAVLIGPAAYHLTGAQLEALWAAHCELNLIPFGTPRPKETDSPTPPSSAGSNGGPSNYSEARSST